MAITRRQLNHVDTYELVDANDYIYRGIPNGTRFVLEFDDRSDMPKFSMVTPIRGMDREWWIELQHLNVVRVAAPVTTVAVPLELAQAFIDAHQEDGRETIGGARMQCAELREFLVKNMPEDPAVTEAKRILKAAGYTVRKK